jgi:tetratricopeptide (TPR) repeat protein
MKKVTQVIRKDFLIPFLVCILGFSAHAQTASETESYNQAMKHIGLLEYTRAKEILDNLLVKNPNLPSAQYQSGLIDLRLNDVPAAEAHFLKVLEIHQKDIVEASIELAKINLKAGKQDEALVYVEKVLQEDQSNHFAYFQRGQIKLKKGDFSAAKEDFNSAILYKNDEYIYYYDRGVALVELEDYNNAIQDFDKVVANIKTTPELENAYFYRGLCYYQEAMDPKYKGHKELLNKALSDYNMCVSLDKKDETAFFNRGEVNMALGHYVDAISDFKHCVMLNPNNYEAHYNKAMCNYHFGEEATAIRDMKTLTVMNPNFTDAIFQLGVWNYEFGENKKALENFNLLITKEKEHADAFYYRGLTYLEMDNTKLACQDFQKAQDLGDKESHKDFVKYCKD